MDRRHLHEFYVGNICFGMEMESDESDRLTVDEHAAPLGAVARAESKIRYQYDFGDDWEHDIVVERITDGGGEGIVCMGGERACPPEDCGGPPGYDRLLTILASPDDEEHAQMKEWVGPRVQIPRR